MTKRNPAAQYRFTAELWEWGARASWYFLSLPEAAADEIEHRYGESAGGFGSVRVGVTIGGTQWRTSLFPDDKRGTYVLPVKKSVRVAESLDAGSAVKVELRVLDRD
jgi:hypothetical protein